MIDQWIFDKKNRQIMKDRLLDNETYTDLSKKYNICIRQLKGIVGNCSKIIQEHL